MAKGDRITYDLAGVFLPGSALSATQLTAMAERLHAIRADIMGDAMEPGDSSEADPGLSACDYAFRELPERILDDYVEHRQQSDLGRILRTARRIRDRVDRIVVVGSQGVLSSIRALLDACCEPFFNELTRSQRGGRPRMLLAGGDLDNDAITGLITLLTEGRSPNRLGDRWALLLVDTPATDLPTQLVGRHLLQALRSFCRDDSTNLAELVVRVMTAGHRGGTLDRATGCHHPMRVPGNLDADFRAFSAAGLLPAAITGMDVVRLLEGASTANDHFRTAPVGANAALDLVGVNHLWRSMRPAHACGMRVWSTALHATVGWYAQMWRRQMWLAANARQAAGDGRCEASAALQAALPAVPAEDILWTEVTVTQCRCDPLMVSSFESDLDGLNTLAGLRQPDLTTQAIGEILGRSRQNGHPTGVFRLACLNEHTLGQWMQMAMLAVAVEQRLALGEISSDRPGTFTGKDAPDFAARFLYEFR